MAAKFVENFIFLRVIGERNDVQNLKLSFKAKDRIAQKLLCFTHDLDTKHQRLF